MGYLNCRSMGAEQNTAYATLFPDRRAISQSIGHKSVNSLTQISF